MTIYRFSTFSFNTDTREFCSGSESTFLRKKVADVLSYLIENNSRPVEKDELLQAIWVHADYRENSLIQSIRELRKLLGDSAHQPKFIRTIHSKGYQWIYSDIEKVNPQDYDFNAEDVDTDKPIEDKEQVVKNVQSKKRYKKVTFYSAAVFCLALLFFIFYGTFESNFQNNDKVLNEARIVVFPFVNKTDDENLNWLELGYSDMFSRRLREVTPKNIVPTYIVQSALAEQQLSYEFNNSLQISTFLKSMSSRFAIAAELTRDDSELVFNYRIFVVDGTVNSGSKRVSNITTSLPTLVAMIVKEIDEQSLLNIGNSDFTNKSAELDYAKGVQALLTKGPLLAVHYFDAALINEPSSIATKIRLAESNYLLGNWELAKKQYRALVEHKANTYDQISIFNGYAQLLLQQGKLEESAAYINKGIELADAGKLPFKKAELLYTLAQLKLVEGSFEHRNSILKTANELMKPIVNLQRAADALYYLGQPSINGIEVSDEINLESNQKKLNAALSYYKQMNNKQGEAKTLLAIGQNYYFDVKTRYQALNEAKELFAETGHLFSLIDTLTYQAFFYIQFHLGESALDSLLKAKELSAQLDDPKRINRIEFLTAFAELDQGIDRGKGNDHDHLNNAIKGFKLLVGEESIGSLSIDSQLLLGWAYSELGHHKKAYQELIKADKRYRTEGFTTSSDYIQTSIMEELLHLNEWEKVIDTASKAAKSHMVNRYHARALYELGEFSQAASTLQQSKLYYPERWNEKDQLRLSHYMQRSDNGTEKILGNEISSHLVYCEALWNMDNIDILDLAKDASN